jgi:hypothetical protein
LYYCSYSNFSSESRVPPRCPSRGLAPGGSFPRGASRPPRSSIVLASDFQRTVLNLFHNHCLPFVFSGCKSTAFFNTRNIFLKYFENNLHLIDLQCYIFRYFARKNLKRGQKRLFLLSKRQITRGVFDEKNAKIDKNT